MQTGKKLGNSKAVYMDEFGMLTFKRQDICGDKL